jgi:hypothetical protein
MPSCTVFFSFEAVDQTSWWQYNHNILASRGVPEALNVAVLFLLEFDARRQQ